MGPAVVESLVLPERFGGLLRATRAEQGLSLDELASRTGNFASVDLAGFEQGDTPVDDGVVRQLTDLYGISLGDLPAHRTHLEIDRSGRVQIGDRTERFKPDADDRQIMLRYLALVYRVRDTAPGTLLPARAGDLGVLADVFGTSPESVRAALDDLMRHSVDELVRKHFSFRTKVIVPAIGALVALTAAGYLVLAPQLTPVSASTRNVRIGTPLIVERDVAPSGSVNVGSAVTVDASPGAARGGSVGPNIGEGVTIER